MTHLALVWLFPRVDTHVDRQATFLNERLPTDIAPEGSFSRVDPHVLLQITRTRKTLMTNIAFVWLLSRMDQDVFPEIAGSTESLIADVTGVHFCCCGSQVDASTRWLQWFTGGCVDPLVSVVHGWIR